MDSEESHIFQLFAEMNWILADLYNRINTDVECGSCLQRAPHGRMETSF